MELVCSLTVLGDLPVLQASGEIDLATLPYFHDQLNRAISLHVVARSATSSGPCTGTRAE